MSPNLRALGLLVGEDVVWEDRYPQDEEANSVHEEIARLWVHQGAREGGVVMPLLGLF